MVNTPFLRVYVTSALIADKKIKLKKDRIIIIHGKGTGILKKATHNYLKKDKRVIKYYIDGMNDGQTILELKI